MPRHRIDPRTSLSKLGEYLVAPPGRRRNIIQDQKNPKAFIVARPGLDPDELMAWVAGHVAHYKRIRRVELVEAIPKSASGKILRRVLVGRAG